VGVTDGDPAVKALHGQQLHPVCDGDVGLRLQLPQPVQRGSGVGGVVAEAVRVGDRGRQRLRQRRGLGHLESNRPHR